MRYVVFMNGHCLSLWCFKIPKVHFFKMTFGILKMDSTHNPGIHTLKSPFIRRGELNETFLYVNR